MALPTFVSAGASVNGAATTITPAWGSSHQADDIGLLFVETAVEAVSAPSGWTELSSSPQSNGVTGSGGTRLCVFWKRATSGAESAASVTAPTDHAIAQILVFRGCKTSGDPWNITSGDASTASTTATCPAVTTTVADCLIVYACADSLDNATGRFSAWAAASLANVTSRSNENTSTGNGGGFSVWTGEKAVAGSTGTGTATISATSRQGRVTIALEPDAGGGTNVTGSGSPSVTLSVTASGTGVVTITGSGSPSVTLSRSASGTGVLTITGSGSPAVTLSVTASGDGQHIQNVTGSGSPSVTLSVSASGAGQHIQNVTGSGAPSVTLSLSASGTGVVTITGSGTPSVTLSRSASGTGVLTITGSGSPSVTLSRSASGTGVHFQNVTGSGAPTVTLSVTASGVGQHGDGTPARRGKGWMRILTAKEDALEEIAAEPEWSPDDLEAAPLPDVGPLPRPRNTEPTQPVRLPKPKREAVVVEDDDDEISFIMHIVLDLD